jgi:hypothetical protein
LGSWHSTAELLPLILTNLYCSIYLACNILCAPIAQQVKFLSAIGVFG